jgi:hypothetical protein
MIFILLRSFPFDIVLDPLGRSSTSLGFHDKPSMDIRESLSSDGNSAAANAPPPSAFITRLTTTGKFLSHTNWVATQPNSGSSPEENKIAPPPKAAVPAHTATAAAELDKLIRARSELKKRSLFSIHSPRSGENGSPASPRSGV